jgi:hypothetical protein
MPGLNVGDEPLGEGRKQRRDLALGDPCFTFANAVRCAASI